MSPKEVINVFACFPLLDSLRPAFVSFLRVLYQWSLVAAKTAGGITDRCRNPARSQVYWCIYAKHLPLAIWRKYRLKFHCQLSDHTESVFTSGKSHIQYTSSLRTDLPLDISLGTNCTFSADLSNPEEQRVVLSLSSLSGLCWLLRYHAFQNDLIPLNCWRSLG